MRWKVLCLAGIIYLSLALRMSTYDPSQVRPMADW